VFKIDEFFKIIDFLKDNAQISDIPPEIRQLALNSQIRTKEMFGNVIDSIPFKSADYDRLRTMLIDWYSAGRTIQDVGNQATDAFSLPHGLLDKSLHSFGFKYGSGITNRIDKVLFLYSLVELYKIKGSPEALKTSLEFFGLYDIQIFEWWVEHNKVENRLYFKSSYVDLGDRNPEEVPIRSMPLEFLELDDHWWYTEGQIKAIHLGGEPLRLPSITPYFSIAAYGNIQNIFKIYAAISRKVSNEWDQFNSTSDINNQKVIFADIYGNNISLSELVLSIGYTYNTWTGRSHGSDDEAYGHYTGSESEYEIIINEYNNMSTRANNRDDQKDKRELLYEKFTKDQTSNFLDIDDTLDNGTKLNLINPTLKSWLDDKILNGLEEDVLRAFLRELDIYVRMHIGLQAISFVNLMLGDNNEDIFKVIDFFKPKRARLFSFELVYAIDDPLMMSIILADNLYQQFRDYHKEIVNHNDRFQTIITQWDKDYLTPATTGVDGYSYDIGNFYDMMPMWLHDGLFTTINQYKDDYYPRLYDTITMNFNYQFIEKGDYFNWDIGAVFDSPCLAVDGGCIQRLTMNNFHDPAIRCRKMDFDRGGIFDLSIPPNGRNKLFDSGFIFDMDCFPVDDGNSWWTCGDDPDYVCKSDILNISPIETPKDVLTFHDSAVDNLYINFFDTLEQQLSHFDSGYMFDQLSVYFRDIVINSITININDEVTDSIRNFDETGHTFDVYSNLLYDAVNIYYTDSTAPTVIMYPDIINS